MKDEIIKKLQENSSWTFPLEEIETIIENKDEYIEELVNILKYTVENLDEVAEDEKNMSHIYSMYLLAKFREKKACPLIIEMISSDEDKVEMLLGDIITEELHRIIASVYTGDMEAIKKVIEDRNVYEYVRDAALRSLLVLVAQGVESREEIIKYFKSLFEGKLDKDDFEIWTHLVNSCYDLHPEEVYNYIKQLYAEDLIDEFSIGLNEVDSQMKRSKESVMRELKENYRFQYIDDEIFDIQNWYSFSKNNIDEIVNLHKNKNSAKSDKAAKEKAKAKKKAAKKQKKNNRKK